MEKRNQIILRAALIIVLLVTASYLYLITEKSFLNGDNISSSESKIIGSTDYGKVTVEGPFGNSSSGVKVAVIVGVHPLESNSHKSIIESIKGSDKSLNYCYYIYRVTVTKDAGNYDKGRMNGQLLANKFVVPHIISQNYDLALDIHSNRGVGDYSKVQDFVFTPLNDKRSKAFALDIVNQMPKFIYYVPKSQTSPQYVTIPIINAGMPAIVYETYMYNSYGITKGYAENLLKAVDNLKI